MNLLIAVAVLFFFAGLLWAACALGGRADDWQGRS